MFYVYAPEGEEPIYPFTLTDLKRKRDGVPKYPTDEDAAAKDCYPVKEVKPPKPPVGQTAVRGDERQANGKWKEVWTLVPTPPEKTSGQWQIVRDERNARLFACDWTQLADAPVSAKDWKPYRQALRDIPATRADPFDIEWPVEPAA